MDKHNLRQTNMTKRIEISFVVILVVLAMMLGVAGEWPYALSVTAFAILSYGAIKMQDALDILCKELINGVKLADSMAERIAKQGKLIYLYKEQVKEYKKIEERSFLDGKNHVLDKLQQEFQLSDEIDIDEDPARASLKQFIKDVKSE